MKRRGKAVLCAVGLLAACALSPIGSAFAEESPDTVSLSIRQDTFFGFYTLINGVHKISENFGLAYGGWWYQDVRGGGSVGGTPWTEIDLGVNITAFDKRLSVTPMIGTVHGSLLSSRSVGINQPAQAFEGIVPNITANWADGFFEAEGYWSYYKSIRSVGPENRASAPAFDANNVFSPTTAGPGTWDFMHYWVNAGVQVHKVVSVGAHWEHLSTTRDSAPGATGQNFYRWIGPYIEFKGPSQTAFRFTAGHDIDSENDFYKMAFTKTF